mmetsp:Transcript_89886/g.201205  ORF Transcript_89886/g.201205 Transcript_89886/m.201205 type:complete len:139 (-) Transcript_89886:206-622(-)
MVATGATAEPVATMAGMPAQGNFVVGQAAYPMGTVSMPGMVATGATAQPFGSTVLAAGPGGAPTVMVPGAPAGSGSMAMSPAMAAMFGGMLKAGSITDDVFNMVDRNQDGVISRSEFRGALKGNIINASAATRGALGR